MASSARVAPEGGLSYDKVSSRQAVTNEGRGNNLFGIREAMVVQPCGRSWRGWSPGGAVPEGPGRWNQVLTEPTQGKVSEPSCSVPISFVKETIEDSILRPSTSKA